MISDRLPVLIKIEKDWDEAAEAATVQQQVKVQKGRKPEAAAAQDPDSRVDRCL